MPRITPYQQQVNPTGPQPPTHLRDTQGAGGVTRIAAGLSEAASALYKRGEQADVAEVSNQVSQAHADFSKQLADYTQNPPADGTSISQAMLEKMNDRIAAIEGAANTSDGAAYAKEMGARVRRHFLEGAMNTEAQIAGAKASADVQKQINNLSSSVVYDPLNYIKAMEDASIMIDAQIRTHNLDPVQAQKIKTYSNAEMAKSSVLGLIKQSPQLAKAKLESGAYNNFITGEQVNALIGAANAEQRRIDEERRRLKKEAQARTEYSYLDDWVSNKLTAEKILRPQGMTPLEPERMYFYLNLLGGESDRLKKDNPAVLEEVLRRIHLPDSDPTKIVDDADLLPYLSKEGQWGLSINTIKGTLRAEVQGLGTQEGKWEAKAKEELLAIAKSKLMTNSANSLIPDPDDRERYGNFTVAMLDTFKTRRKMGIPAHDLLTPGNPQYLGNLIQNYMPGRGDVMEAFRKQMNFKPPVEVGPFPLEFGPNGRNSFDAVYGDGAYKRLQDASVALVNTPGLLEPGNIDLSKRPKVQNQDGSISTIKSISVEIDGKEVLLPTISPTGQVWSKEEAIAAYKSTGQHLGIFQDAKTANDYAEKLHKLEEIKTQHIRKRGETPLMWWKRIGH